MKRNPQTKIELGDDSPVMNCRAIRCRKMNGSDDSKAWGVGATLVPKEKLGMEKMGAMTQQRCTVTQSDVKAAWSMLQVIIAEALANGQRVELGELGTLSVGVRAKRLKEPGERLRAADIEVGSFSFKPGVLLQKQLGCVTFKVDNNYSEPTDAEALDMALYNYFAIEGHEGIKMKKFCALCGYGITRAREILKEYIDQGVMERVPMSNGYYRPTKGNFGRES
jgi:nucleoid DNA-binding protein